MPAKNDDLDRLQTMLSTRISVSVYRRLTAYRKAAGQSLSRIVNEALREYLDRREKQKPDRR
jgi:predicted transcriptional regulator